MRRFGISASLLVILLLVMAGEVSACSFVSLKLLHVRCGTEELRATWDPGEAINLSGMFDRMGDACGESPAALEQFFTEQQKFWEYSSATLSYGPQRRKASWRRIGTGYCMGSAITRTTSGSRAG
jgi:hypothetical protein